MSGVAQTGRACVLWREQTLKGRDFLFDGNSKRTKTLRQKATERDRESAKSHGLLAVLKKKQRTKGTQDDGDRATSSIGRPCRPRTWQQRLPWSMPPPGCILPPVACDVLWLMSASAVLMKYCLHQAAGKRRERGNALSNAVCTRQCIQLQPGPHLHAHSQCRQCQRSGCIDRAEAHQARSSRQKVKA